jgi:hypothetical protein
MLEEFWGDLVRSLALVAKDYDEIKVILLLFVDGTLETDCLADEYRCTPDSYQKHKLLEISLESWDREDIRRWIAKYSGLQLNRTQLGIMADKVYGATEGFPGLVVHELLKECCPAMDG